MSLRPVKLPKENRDQIIASIQQHFEIERGEHIGELAADSLLQFFMTEIGPYLYNQALSDCRTLISQRMVAMEEDVYALEQPIKRSR